MADEDSNARDAEVKTNQPVHPYTVVAPSAGEFNNTPYVQSVLSLYREGMNSQRPNYQYLCWYKIVEGINVKREEETTKLKVALALKFPEPLEESES